MCLQPLWGEGDGVCHRPIVAAACTGLRGTWERSCCEPRSPTTCAGLQTLRWALPCGQRTAIAWAMSVDIRGSLQGKARRAAHVDEPLGRLWPGEPVGRGLRVSVSQVDGDATRYLCWGRWVGGPMGALISGELPSPHMLCQPHPGVLQLSSSPSVPGPFKLPPQRRSSEQATLRRGVRAL